MRSTGQRSRRPASSRATRARWSARSTAGTRRASARSTPSASRPESVSQPARCAAAPRRVHDRAMEARPQSAGTSSRRVPVAVLGATGYAGVELLRLLARHPAVEIVCLSSEQYRERRASQVYPFLAGIVDLPLAAPDGWRQSAAEIVFSALPHGASASHVRDIVADGRRALDISADFRLRDPAVYARWYGPHAAPELLEEAVYGLPEIYRDALRAARLVAVPGCYPTRALLGAVPLAAPPPVRRAARGGGGGRERVGVDAKSGTTGAGRSLKVDHLFAEVNENCRPYAIGGHRHQPEIDQELRRAGAGASCLFVPHLLPVSRGIISTM